MPFKIVIEILEDKENKRMKVQTSGIIVGYVTEDEQKLANFIKDRLLFIEETLKKDSKSGLLVTKVEFDNPKRIK